MTLKLEYLVKKLTEEMQTEIFIGVVLIVAALFLVIAVLFQSSKEKGMSGAIGGSSSSDTYYGKNKANSRDYILNKLTVIVSIVFALIVIISFVIQKEKSFQVGYDEFVGAGQTTVTSGSSTTTDGSTTTEGTTTTPETTTGADTTTAAE